MGPGTCAFDSYSRKSARPVTEPTSSMLLFYSDYCQHCKMLIDNVKRLDEKGSIKLYNIDKFARPAQVQSVPALLLLPGRNIIYGKQVFDHLLLPGRGVLVSSSVATAAVAAPMKPSSEISGGPVGFSSLKAQTSSSFALIEDSSASPLGSLPESWAWMGGEDGGGAGAVGGAGGGAGGGSSPFGIETRDTTNKALPEMDDIMARREQDLRILT